MENNSVDLSIIIVHYNTPQDIDVCLESVYKFTKRITFEIFVIDNNSPDRKIDEVMKKYPLAMYRPLKDNLGFSAGNNVGIKEAKGEFVILLNPDTYLLDDALSGLVKFMRQSGAGVSAPRLLDAEGNLQYDGLKLPTITSYIFGSFQLDTRFPKNRILGQHFMGWWDRKDTREVDWVPGAALLIRTDIVRKLDGLDENIFMFGEDTDLCWRTMKLGFKVYLRGEEKIVHHYGKAAVQNIPKRIVSTHAGKLYVIRKNRSAAYFYLYYATMIITVSLKLVLLGFSASVNRNEYSKNRYYGYLWCFRYLIHPPKTATIFDIMKVKPSF